MAQLFIHLRFSRIQSHEALIACFIDHASIGKDDDVRLLIEFDVTSVCCDYLALIVAYVKSLEARDIPCAVDFQNLIISSSPAQYAARIGFFRLLGKNVPVLEKQMKCVCRCSDIAHYDDILSAEQASLSILDNITDNTSLHPSLVYLTRYSLNELLDNVLAHADSPAGAFVVSQYAPFKGEIRLLVCDTGKGLFNVLSDAERNAKSYLKSNTALSRIAEFAIDNKSELLIHSGRDTLRIWDGKMIMQQAADWQGTYIFMSIKTDQPVDEIATFEDQAPLLNNYGERSHHPAFASIN
jgi:hypothetical protein